MSEVTGTFLKVATLKKWDRFRKFQDIDRADFVTKGLLPSGHNVPALGYRSLGTNLRRGNVVHFISHRWNSPNHPDPSGEQLEWIKQEFKDDDNALIWYDYCCLPQEPRTPAQDQTFRLGIEAIPTLIRRSWFIVLAANADGYSERAWCQFEAVIAQNSGRHPPLAYLGFGANDSELEFGAKTNLILRQSSLYKILNQCMSKLPKDTEAAKREEKEDSRYAETGYYLAGYYLDVPDLNDPAFAAFKTSFFQLQASMLADPPMLWELLRKLFLARREDHTYRGY